MQVLRMRGTYRYGYGADVQTTVESTDQIQAGREDQSDVIAGIHAPFLVQKTAYAFGPLVQFRTRQHLGRCAFTVEQGEQDVV